MALRFMQIYLPGENGIDLDQFLKGHEITGSWHDTSMENRLVVNLLVTAEETEEIMDRFENAFSGDRGFHVVLFPVEAVLPNPQKVEQIAPSLQESKENNSQPKPARISREELYNDIRETIELDRVFFAMTILSAIVAAVGLLSNNVPIIIGAMVIAPLLGPNVAMSLGTALGDFNLLRQAVIANFSGVAVVLIFSILVGALLGVDPTIPAIATRSHLTLYDLALALASGAAGTLAFTKGLSEAVIGVMVAVALIPPLVTLGILIGSGHLVLALGALLLVAANIIGINLAGVATFLAQGVRPRTWWEEEKAKRSTRAAMIIWIVLLLILAAILYATSAAGLKIN